MDKGRKNNKHQHNLRTKSPIIMSGKSKRALFDCDMHSTPKMHYFNKIPKVYFYYIY